MKTYYDLLHVAPTASAAEIKQAFRQTIARYHPDKVQHLGAEFQELAQLRSAELTAAYKTLVDPDRRAEYDRSLREAEPRLEAAAPPPSTVHAGASPRREEEAGRTAASFNALRSGRDVLVRRAALNRVEHVFEEAFASHESPAVAGFDLSCFSKARLFDRSRERPWLLAKFVSRLDRHAVHDAWRHAIRANALKKAAVSIFLLAADLAPEPEIADAVASNRRLSDGSQLITVVPVDVRDWRSWVPQNADPAVRALARRLSEA